MGRHRKAVTITAKGRDIGKTFIITEMDADKGERWALRALFALSRGGIEVPPGMFDQGWIGLASIMPYVLVIGLRSLHGAQWLEVEPLLDEMMECVRWSPPGTAQREELLQTLHAGGASQIEEISTRFFLRKEVLQLHMGFSWADALSTSGTSPSPSDTETVSAS